jgi:hypothetical protein
VTILGNKFTGTSEVAFNNTVAAFSVDSDTQIRATVPAGATTGKISVTTPAGKVFASTNFTVEFPPSISAFTPTSGPSGTQVTITGTSFAGTTAVAFNGAAAAGFTVDSDTQIKAFVPSSATTGKITVTNDAGTATSATNFTVTASSNLTLTPVADAQVKDTSPGNNYGALANIRVREGTTASPGIYHSYLKFNVTGLSGSVTSARLRLFVETGTSNTVSVFSTTDAWTELGINWSNAPAPGTLLTTAVPSTAGAYVDITLPANVFAAGNGSYNFVLTSNGTQSGYFTSREGSNPPQLVGGLGTVSAPSISSFAPTSGPVGTEVTINGSHFSGTTAVKFNTTNATTFTVDSDSKIRANVPTAATTGKITVTNSAGSAVSSETFTVSTSTPAPTITSFTPASGPVGTQVTIAGTNFTGATAVTFNNTAASTFTVDSAAQVRATVAAGTTSGTIAVTTPGGTASSATSFTVTTSGGGGGTFLPTDDSQVKDTSPDTNYGTVTPLRVREGTVTSPNTYHTYLKFNVTGLSGSPSSAKLRLFVETSSGNTFAVSSTATTWTETAITWNNAPVPGTQLATFFPTSSVAYIDITLPLGAFVTGNGTYSFVIASNGTTSAFFTSREGVNPPQLVLQ